MARLIRNISAISKLWPRTYSQRFHWSLSKLNRNNLVLSNFTVGNMSLQLETDEIFRRQLPTATYEDVKQVEKRHNVWLIDVRTRDEVKETGVIPKSVNIPLDELSTALECNEEYFFNKYKCTKPSKDSEIILSCRSGRRSKIAYGIAEKLGYTNLKNFEGGFENWAKREFVDV